MATDYLRMTAEILVALPVGKQEEVYDFAQFLKESVKPLSIKRKHKKGSILNLIGIGVSGSGNIALNHDKYLYE